MSSLAIGLAETDTDIARCFPVMVQLRPHLIEADFVARIRRMAAESYRLAFLTDETGVVRSVGGHRLMDRLHAGRMFMWTTLSPMPRRVRAATATGCSTGWWLARGHSAATSSRSIPAHNAWRRIDFICGSA